MAQLTAPPVPAVAAASRGRRMLAPALTIGGLAAATVALHVRDPHTSGSWGYCPSAALGFWCPGCGGLRAVNDLTNGDLAAAASSNLLFVILLPAAVVLLGVWALDRWTGRSRHVGRGWQVALLVLAGVTVGFTVLRNLPPGGWLAP